jgi:hypothetical protein
MMYTSHRLITATPAFSSLLISRSFAETKTVLISELDLSIITSGWGKPAANHSIAGNRA